MNIICPYCKKELKVNGRFDISIQYKCTNHKSAVFLYTKDHLSINLISLYTEYSIYNIVIDYVNNNMVFNYKHHNIKLPIDNSLTPENLEQKARTYLIFQ